MRAKFAKVQQFIHKYIRYVTPAALFGGFALDNIILQRIDSTFTFIILSYYFSLVSLGIILLHVTHNSHARKLVQLLRSGLNILIPFSFGALFSGFFIFYSQSAGSVLSWVFLLIFLLFMVSTEYYKEHYNNTLVQVTLWYFTLLSFLILYTPIAFKQIGAGVFILAGVFSLIIAWGFLLLLSKVEPGQYYSYAPQAVRNIIMVFITINVLYFANIIPPIPLALKDAGAYYNVTRQDAGYALTTQEYPWYSPKHYLPTTLYLAEGEGVSVFSSIFAPSRLSPQIFHQWQYKDEQGKWQTASTIEFSITGGRDNGFRGYTTKEYVWPGKWRVRIITKREQVIGVTNFTIKPRQADQQLNLTTVLSR